MDDERSPVISGEAAVGADRHECDTPALQVDLDVMEANIARMARCCRENGIAWRPHTKGIKVPEIARKLIQAGASGITCAKLGEAEAMAEAGLRDILIANQIVGPRKIARLMALRRRADVIVSVDDRSNIRALAQAARQAGLRQRVVIETQIGIRRAGADPGPAVVELARFIAAEEGLVFSGVMGWEGHAAPMTDPVAKAAAVKAAVADLARSAEACRAAGLGSPIVSCGGTGTYWLSAAQPGVTEIQAGGGIFGDVHYRTHFGVDHPYALHVMATVISRPYPHRIVCDAGKKAMSGDVALPLPLGLEGVKLVRLSAEHSTIELESPNTTLKVGDHLDFVVGYSDTTVHLHDTMYGVRRGRIEAVWRVLDRGSMR